MKENLKVRIDEIIQVIKDRQEALEEFDEGILNALVEKIKIISPAHFAFELKSGVRVDGRNFFLKKGFVWTRESHHY